MQESAAVDNDSSGHDSHDSSGQRHKRPSRLPPLSFLSFFRIFRASRNKEVSYGRDSSWCSLSLSLSLSCPFPLPLFLSSSRFLRPTLLTPCASFSFDAIYPPRFLPLVLVPFLLTLDRSTAVPLDRPWIGPLDQINPPSSPRMPEDEALT